MRISRRFLACAVPLTLWTVASPSMAVDAVRNATERAADRRDLREDRAATSDDRGDRLEIEILRDDFGVARAAGDAARLAVIDGSVEAYLDAEVGESVGEVRDAKQEIGRDRREIRSDRREIRSNRRTPSTPAEGADDRRDRRDDRRDRRDDRRDLSREAIQAESLAQIRTDWTALPDDARNADALAVKAALLEGLVAKARAEIGQDVRESREDRRELREDRLETREDRRDP